MNLNQSYPHPRPTVPIQLYLLVALAIAGLAALWLAAFHAFLQIMGPAQAFFAASLIEAGLIVEALALIKRPRVWYTWTAVVISAAVSATYNYIQAATAVTGTDGTPALGTWPLLTLALGPLAALAFVSLTLGHELSEYQNRVSQWQIDRTAWIEARRQEAEAREQRQEAERLARLDRLQEAERQRQAAEAERRWQAEQSEREWQHKRQERAERLAERQERQVEPAQDAQVATPGPAVSDPAPLKCQHCGATSGKSGAPFRTQAALNAHQAHCPGSSQLQPVTLPVMLSANGKESH